MHQPTCKIVAVHHGTKKRFIYGTIGDFSNPDFYGEEYNPTPIPYILTRGTTLANVNLRRFRKTKPDFRVFAEWA